ncbi:MAG: 3-isopropylmalate dehydratase large subunit, partial [Alphaproteobacteria bacterium]|nr:3-isopropylmalate dehydratase large subunit [Alphaproteobacteria bacterium]
MAEIAPSLQPAAHPPRTLFDKIWDDHIIAQLGDGTYLLHIDRHLIHEVTSKRAFEQLRWRGPTVRNPELTFALVDHIVATAPKRDDGSNPAGRPFIEAWRPNCADFGIIHFALDDRHQGIVQVIAPELGIDLPGCAQACGDSHTSRNGALGALAWGIGASEVEHVLAKGLILYVIGRLGRAAGRGHVVEYAGSAISALPMDGRLTVCNMSIEMGARAGLIAPDKRIFAYLAGWEFAPRGAACDAALANGRTLATDDGAIFEREETFDCTAIKPQITWGTSPQDVIAIDEPVPDPHIVTDAARRQAMMRARAYLDITPGRPLTGTKIDYALIGSCTNGRYGDLEAAARIVRGRKVASGVRALVVPGSMRIKREAERAGLDRVFTAAGFEWHAAGCSMCVTAN